MLNEFMTVEFLATFAGLTVATGLIVQFTKSLFKSMFGDSVVRIYTFAIAVVLSFIFANNGFDVQGVTLTLINAIVISVSAMGGYEVIADPKALKSK